MNVIKKASVVGSEQDAQEITQPQITPEPEEMQVENMTIKEIVAECELHYCCGDCKIKPLCQAYFIGEKPHKWRLYEGRH
jgi:hypothetical protein